MRSLLAFLIILTAGLAANVSCSGSGAWAITDQNVVCDGGLPSGVTSVTVAGYSNVSFTLVSASGVSLTVSGNSEFNISSSAVSNTEQGVTYSFAGRSVRVLNTTLGSTSRYHRLYAYASSFYANNLTQIGYSSGGCYGACPVVINSSNFTLIYSSIVSESVTFYNTTNYIIRDSSFTPVTYWLDAPSPGVFFQPNTRILFSNTTIRVICLSSGSVSYNISNISSSYAGYAGYIRGSDGVEANFTNASVVYLNVSLLGSAVINVTNSTLYVYGYPRYGFMVSDNVTAEVADSTLLNTDNNPYFYFGGRSVRIVNSTFGSTGRYHTLNMSAISMYVYRLTQVGYTNGDCYGACPLRINVTNLTIRYSNFTFQRGDFYNYSYVIQDCRFTTAPYSPVGIIFNTSSVVNATNVTFPSSKYFADNGVLYVKNNFTLFVNDSAGRALRNVSVSAYNSTSGEVDFNGSTDSFGWLNTSLLWYKQNATQAYNVTLTINLTGGDALNQTSYDMNTNKWYNVTMGGLFNYFVGNPSTASFTPTITVYYGNDSLKPWNGSRQVELRQGTIIAANFSWNFSAGDLNLSNVTITRSTDEHYVGINGTNVTPFVTTVWVPVWGKTCNVKICAGKANYSHCSANDWTAASSEPSGEYCVLAVNGTVAQDRPTAITTKIVIKVPGWDEPLVAALFAAAFLVFALRTRRTVRRKKR